MPGTKYSQDFQVVAGAGSIRADTAQLVVLQVTVDTRSNGFR